MVAFAEHYVFPSSTTTSLNDDDTSIFGKPLRTFLQQKENKKEPIFAGVVWNDWENSDNSNNLNDDNLPSSKLSRFKQHGIEYVRMHCNLGYVRDNEDAFHQLAHALAHAAQQCQAHQLVPLLLLQVPWREFSSFETKDSSLRYFQQAIRALATALSDEGVDCSKLILETRPPIGISAQEEREQLDSSQRQALGLQVGKNMFDVLQEELSPILGFCVAGGSTKGVNPPAMQDDTQNAVRQGIRLAARTTWGYDLCFWEMGAKLLLQPQVGQLWGEGDKDGARDLFCRNAKAMAEEIQTEIITSSN
ncbi:MAG: hypothetical protein SGBAC_012445 [Bacillariaceae sp.]